MNRWYLLMLISANLMALGNRDCMEEGRLSAEDIIAQMPEASTEKKIKECCERGEFFESQVENCDKKSFDAGCEEKIKEQEGDGA